MTRIFALIILFILTQLSAQEWKTEDQYIQKFARYAVEEMEKYKIPASITLAQGLLETGGGQSRLAVEGNNHFGIKCKEDWTGKTMKHTDDAPNECFRVYDDPKESYEDHSKFLAFRKYYTKLFTLDPKDYKAWAHGLKKAGYATNPKYAYILINKIEKYKLYEFDNTNSKEVYFTLNKLYPGLAESQPFLAKNDQIKNNSERNRTSLPINPPIEKEKKTVVAKKPEPVAKVEKVARTLTKYDILNAIEVKNHPNGGMKFFVVPNDIELSLIAKKFRMGENQLRKMNETETDIFKKNDIVFLEYKKPEGTIATYTVANGETMYDISQKFGIRLNRLYYRNRMASNEQPKAGELIYLQGRKPN